MSNSLRPHELQHTRPPCPSPTPGTYSNHAHRIGDTIQPSSIIPFSSCPHSFPASGSFLMSQPFTTGGQIIGASASAAVLSMNIQVWFPLMFSSVQSFSRVWLFATPWTTACQASLSLTNSQTLLKLMSIELVMPSNYFILCHSLVLLSSIFTK